MTIRFHRSLLLLLLPILTAVPLAAQEAVSGLDLRTTVSGEASYAHELTTSPRDGTPIDAAFRAVVYPTLKINGNWTVAGAVQFSSTPYFTADFSTPGHAVTTRILRANIGYSRFWKSGSAHAGSLVIRAGQLSSAVGAFNLRYDDAVNPLVDLPILYGYNGMISTAGVAGVQADFTGGKWDARAHLANSSLMNPRSPFERDQYANWAGGAGYTILQGLRVGVSGARGPYLNRDSPYFLPGESNPSRLPASTTAADVQYGRGHWNLEGEWTWTLMPYHAIPSLRREGAYIEAKRVLTPRWYAAVRNGYVYANGDRQELYEIAVGYHAGTHEMIKAEYEIERDASSGEIDRYLMLQLVTTVHPVSLAWR